MVAPGIGRQVTYQYGAVDPQAVDALVHRNGRVDQMTYDISGNLTARDFHTGGRTDFTWDGEDQLREASGPGGTTHTHRGHAPPFQTTELTGP